jgi:outer membrane protein
MKRLAWLLATPLLASPLWAADLLQIYREARDNDATFAAAQANLEAGREKLPKGAPDCCLPCR